MRTKTVLRYYCDFCSKGTFRKPDAARHEASCTLNPKRKCYLCGGSVGALEIAAEMKKRDDVFLDDEQHPPVWNTKTKAAATWLMKQVSYCPACALSVLRQGKIMAFDCFNYKDEVRDWHNEQNEPIC